MKKSFSFRILLFGSYPSSLPFMSTWKQFSWKWWLQITSSFENLKVFMSYPVLMFFSDISDHFLSVFWIRQLKIWCFARSLYSCVAAVNRLPTWNFCSSWITVSNVNDTKTKKEPGKVVNLFLKLISFCSKYIVNS